MTNSWPRLTRIFNQAPDRSPDSYRLSSREQSLEALRLDRVHQLAEPRVQDAVATLRDDVASGTPAETPDHAALIRVVILEAFIRLAHHGHL